MPLNRKLGCGMNLQIPIRLRLKHMLLTLRISKPMCTPSVISVLRNHHCAVCELIIIRPPLVLTSSYIMHGVRQGATRLKAAVTTAAFPIGARVSAGAVTLAGREAAAVRGVAAGTIVREVDR